MSSTRQKKASFFSSVFTLLITSTIVTLFTPSLSTVAAAVLQVGARPKGIAINSATQKAVITNKKDNTISVIDLVHNTVTATIPVGRRPVDVAVNTETNNAITVNKKDNSLTVISLNGLL